MKEIGHLFTFKYIPKILEGIQCNGFCPYLFMNQKSFKLLIHNEQDLSYKPYQDSNHKFNQQTSSVLVP